MKKTFQNKFLFKLIIFLFVVSSSGFTVIVKKCLMSDSCCSKSNDNCCKNIGTEKKISKIKFNCSVKYLSGKLNSLQSDFKNKYESTFISLLHTTIKQHNLFLSSQIPPKSIYFVEEKFLLFSQLLI